MKPMKTGIFQTLAPGTCLVLASSASVAEEPDVQAMMAAVKQDRNTLNHDMQGILRPVQQQALQD